MAKFQTKSGADVDIKPADFEAAMELHDAVMEEAANLKLNLDFGFIRDKSLAELDVADVAPVLAQQLLPAFAKLASSKRVKAAAFAALSRSTYKGERISLKTFEPEAARADYYEVLLAGMKETLTPFFKGLLSSFAALTMTKTAENTPK